MSEEARLRERICRCGASLFARGLTFGSTGNISASLPGGGWLMTPTNASLGELDPARLSRLDAQGRHVDGDKPTKEAVLHQAMYVRPPSDLRGGGAPAFHPLGRGLVPARRGRA